MRVNLLVGLYYGGLGFTTQSSLETDNGDGTKTYYTFYIDYDSVRAHSSS